MDRISLDEVRAHGDPGMIFLNVNTPADRDRAAEISARAPRPETDG